MKTNECQSTLSFWPWKWINVYKYIRYIDIFNIYLQFTAFTHLYIIHRDTLNIADTREGERNHNEQNNYLIHFLSDFYVIVIIIIYVTQNYVIIYLFHLKLFHSSFKFEQWLCTRIAQFTAYSWYSNSNTTYTTHRQRECKIMYIKFIISYLYAQRNRDVELKWKKYIFVYKS